MKNPLTPAGIEPATFLFVAQHLNHCATAVPLFYLLGIEMYGNPVISSGQFLSIYPSGFITTVAVFRKPNAIPLCFSIDLVLNFLLSWLLVLLPSTFFLDVRPLFLLSSGTHSIINFGIFSSGILLTWPYHCSLFFSMMSMMSGFPFTPIISFICYIYSGQFYPYNICTRCKMQ